MSKQTIEKVIASMDGPLSVKTFFEKILKNSPNTAKHSQSSTRTDLRDSYDDPEAMMGSIELSPEEAKQIYTFKANLKHRKGLWRTIEIQGEQTLGDFDRELRSAFEHDWDHMSGFWKLFQQGKRKKYSEEDLGSLNSFGEGEATDVSIAELELSVGGRLKYVYDFGDWVEHDIVLESLANPEAGAKYPRVVAKNKPRYRYCASCKKKGRKTRATWFCVQCSDEKGKTMNFCDDCCSKFHEVHYITEIVY